ncbi:hypothetical protein BOTBODRAFT_28611 [Botryobasidium botryosum FD-172 SS1]|uniref:Uncharacterized protein n=1 Tax=Botryobasidium botryosum (strain FD-172 SS1) TaxID=930990 RepID=A0A067MU29_BOTB1|nr:hypothetical protein BOTBODRAFT_28611 [Botryobasidium botryosum FD-172 SS1]
MVSLTAQPTPEPTMSSAANVANPWESETQEQGYIHVAPGSTLVQRDIYSRARHRSVEIDEENVILPTEDASPPQVDAANAPTTPVIPVTTPASSFATEVSSIAHRAACNASRFAGVFLSGAARFFMVSLRIIPVMLVIAYAAMVFMRRMHDDARFDAVWGPVCNNPSVSFICPPPHIPRATTSTRIPDIPELIRLQTGFEGIVESSFGMTSAVDLKQSEIALRDLNILVKASDLEARQSLSSQLVKVVAQAKKTGEGLQKLGGKVGTAVDSTLAMDDYMLRSLANINHELIASGITGGPMKGLIPFWSRSASVVEEQKQELARVFEEASAQLKTWIEKLNIEAMASITELERLDDMLYIIYETVITEKKDIESKEKALSKLWASLIDDSRAAMFESHKDLLDNITIYRKAALNRVQLTAVQLRQLGENLDNLRDRMAAPSLVGTQYTNQGKGLPIEAHMTSIREGIEKMNDFRSRGLQRENEALGRMISAPPV